MKFPDLREEKKLLKKGYKRIVGLDEAGRGPLAGPVITCAISVGQFSILNFQILKIRDSKKLTLKKREKFFEILTNHPQIKWGIGRVSAKVIDKINILQATKLAMKRAVLKLKQKPDFLILDGISKIDLEIPQKSIKGADEKVFSCACASIIAKVYRDKIMKRYHRKYSKYGFEKHKGYPTKYHLKMLKKYGPCKIHRKSFGPVANCLENCE